MGGSAAPTYNPGIASSGSDLRWFPLVRSSW